MDIVPVDIVAEDVVYMVNVAGDILAVYIEPKLKKLEYIVAADIVAKRSTLKLLKLYW